MSDLAKNKTHIVLVNAVIEKDGKILITQRSLEETHEPGKWTIPGGKVEKTAGDAWDILEKTLAREIEEEVDIKISETPKLLVNNTFIRSTRQHVIALTFLCGWKSGEAKALEDTIDVNWIYEKDLGSYDFAPNVRTYIEKGFDFLRRYKFHK